MNGNTDEASRFDGLKNKSLKATGYAYLAADAALALSGALARDYKVVATGALWGLGGAAVACYGNPDAEKQLELLSRRLGKYLQEEGIVIPKAPNTELLAKEGGVIERIESFLYKYPSQALNAVFAAGGGFYLASGLQHKKTLKATSGALVMAGALTGLLLPEKQSDPEHSPRGTAAKALAWAQEKPLRVSGMLYGINNITMATHSALELRKEPKNKSHLFSLLAASCYIFGNTMLFLSSKSHKGGNEHHRREAMEHLAETSAQVIAAQAPQVREALVQNISGFLAAQEEVHMKEAEIAQLLHAKLDEVGRGKMPVGWQGREQGGKGIGSALS